jgi:Fanconi anemia group M protein
MEDLEFKEGMQRIFELEAKDVEHPKLGVLLEIVKKQLQTKPDSKIIIFANFRSSVERITQMLQAIETCKPIMLIGQSGNQGLTQKEQLSVLKKFDIDQNNVLVCTSIGEEGISIGSLDVAIFYESVPSAIRTIQRSGRVGRCKVGKVIMLITKDTIDEKYYWIAFHKEKKMKKVLNEIQQESERM